MQHSNAFDPKSNAPAAPAPIPLFEGSRWRWRCVGGSVIRTIFCASFCGALFCSGLAVTSHAQGFPANPPVIGGPPPLPPGATLVPPQSSSRAVGPVTQNAFVDSDNDSRNVAGGTHLEPPIELLRLIEDGGVPATLDELRLLQRQQQRVAGLAEACTVSVQIGPAQGCGVIITPSGFVLTAAHVAMRPGESAMLTLNDGRTVTAKTLGMNRGVDAGLMKISPGQNSRDSAGREIPWPHASLGTSDGLKSGMWCIATGHPGGYEADRGMVTRVGRILAVYPDRLVTDCALIGGDSGGPLFDLSGKLIGVHSRIGNDVADNLHVPVDHYNESWDRMQSGDAWGFLPGFRPVLGIRGNSEGGIANVVKVGPGSPAEAGGIRPGDQVVSFGKVDISDFESLKAAVSDTMPGERVKIWLRREGRPVKVTVEIGRGD
ncbi:S1C family serine protease [Rhodopirellula sp. JC740]|uniref:S1C family serine protease n=1 Tax=Rhodopirellula halodulae TaxID=2894198 RepID=A0ABS8NB35_9BACT|nr:trypsin-like peptidase domain-containing protein [Rhodopirellula sp. JC740]MCC9640763.1 S1C family serine protease [Rhodopirellula sp. JC740]